MFDIALWTGQGNTNDRTITTSFNPDLVWIKSRSDGTYNHALFDSNRGFGTNNVLSSNTSGAQGATDEGYVKSTTSTSMTLGVSGGGNAYYNGNNFTYVGWTWDAGTSTVTNTAGSISSQVRANASAGFSVVTYTGTLSGSGNATVGHGLGVTPQLVITKARSGSSRWAVQMPTALSANNYLELNSTSAQASWGAQTRANPTSTVFDTIYAGGVNENGVTYVAYCFAPVAGYSSFGSYTGNGSADGPFVYTGFRPMWLLIKGTNAGYTWYAFDAQRNPYNGVDAFLNPNNSGAESTAAGQLYNFLSNGFKLLSGNGELNQSGSTYSYACFAESPFQYARAR